ncbi:hypothetical protein HUU62_15145 [Rhodoferax sp. 4810]|nr:hypothetical protein [Rhodoferax jenense]
MRNIAYFICICLPEYLPIFAMNSHNPQIGKYYVAPGQKRHTLCQPFPSFTRSVSLLAELHRPLQGSHQSAGCIPKSSQPMHANPSFTSPKRTPLSPACVFPFMVLGQPQQPESLYAKSLT